MDDAKCKGFREKHEDTFGQNPEEAKTKMSYLSSQVYNLMARKTGGAPHSVVMKLEKPTKESDMAWRGVLAYQGIISSCDGSQFSAPASSQQ